jgi:hypothetical protein
MQPREWLQPTFVSTEQCRFTTKNNINKKYIKLNLAIDSFLFYKIYKFYSAKLYERKNRGKTMANIKIEEATKQVEKKLVALEMSKDMWKQVRLEAVDNDLSFSAMVRVIISKYLRESDAKLNSTVKEEELQDGKL